MTTTIVGSAVQLQLRAPLASWQGLYDRLEVWRASSEGGPYTELTAALWLGARVPADASDAPASPVTGAGASVVGMTFSVLINEQTQVDVTFTGTNPLTFQQAATQIQAQGLGLITSWVTTDGRIAVQSVEPGNKAILRILATDAAALLGLPTTSPDWVNYGKDARLQLVSGQEVYLFTDVHGDPSFFYKTRLRNSSSGNVSDFSLPIPAGAIGKLDPSLLVLGTVDIVDLSGRPVEGREVAVYTKFNGLTSNGFAVVPTDQRQPTDANGHAEFQLIRGTTVTVSIAGTALVRDVTVPTDPAVTSFRLLDPSVGSDDVFAVQVPNIDYAVRRTL